jgi:transposase InsO family protein
VNLHGFAGEKVPAAGKAKVQVAFEGYQGTHTVYVLQDFKRKAILGGDVLKAAGAIVNYQAGVLEIPSSQTTIKVQSVTERATFVVGDRVAKADPRFDEALVLQTLAKFQDTLTEADVTKPAKVEPMRIRLTRTAIPEKARLYGRPAADEEFIEAKIKELLKKGFIRRSKSGWGHSIVLARQKGKKEPRFCINYKLVNAFTKTQAYPMPTFQLLKDRWHGTQWITTIDIKSAYHQCPLHPKDREKTAFMARSGLYEWNVVPFGLVNAPAYFQDLMSTALQEIADVTVFIDDIGIFSKTLEEHAASVSKVLAKLKEMGLKVSAAKCKFFVTETKFLGSIVDREGIRADPEKTQAVAKLLPPASKKELKSFLGTAQWFSAHIPQLGSVSAPLNELLKKDVKWKWSPAHQRAFEYIKRSLISEPVMLAYPDPTRKFFVRTDASDVGIGAVLYQLVRGEERIVEYASRKCIQAERNYSASERELLAIVWSIRRWHRYLAGQHFVVITDHKSLETIRGVREAKSRLARWAETLAEYNFEVRHRPGKENVVADTLSRLDTEQEIEEKEPLVFAIELETMTRQKWAKLQAEDPGLRKLFEEAAQAKPGNKFFVKEEVLFKFVRSGPTEWAVIVVPEALRTATLEQQHDQEIAGHQGSNNTYLRMRMHYFWPGMYADTVRFVVSCKKCQATKMGAPTKLPLGTVSSNKPCEFVAMDIVKLPTTSAGHTCALVLGDIFTRFFVVVPMKTQTAEETAKAILERWIGPFGVPEKMLSDQGGNFSSQLMTNTLELLKIRKLWTTSYHPQANGMVERFNRTLIKMVKALLLFLWTPTPKCSAAVDGCDCLVPVGVRQESRRSAQGGEKTPGDEVMRLDPTVKTASDRKTRAEWYGPCEVTERIHDLLYKVKFDGKEDTVNAAQLKPFFRRAQPATKAKEPAKSPGKDEKTVTDPDQSASSKRAEKEEANATRPSESKWSKPPADPETLKQQPRQIQTKIPSTQYKERMKSFSGKTAQQKQWAAAGSQSEKQDQVGIPVQVAFPPQQTQATAQPVAPAKKQPPTEKRSSTRERVAPNRFGFS